MPQYNHALCSYSIPRVKYTSAFNFVASYSDYEMIILLSRSLNQSKL